MPNDDDTDLYQSDADGLRAIEFVANYVAGLGCERLDPLQVTDVGLLMNHVYDTVGRGLDIEDLENALKERGLAPDVVEMVLSLWCVALYSNRGPSKWRDVDVLNF